MRIEASGAVTKRDYMAWMNILWEKNDKGMHFI